MINQISPASILSLSSSIVTLLGTTLSTLSTTNIDKQQSFVTADRQTLVNYLDIINAYYIQFWMNQEFNSISNFDPAAVGLVSSDQDIINARLDSFQSFVQTVYPLQIWIPFNVNSLFGGQPAIQSYDLLSYFASFNSEVIPDSLNSVSDLQASAQAEANAWNNILSFWSVNLSFNPATYSAVERMYYASQTVANAIGEVVGQFDPAYPMFPTVAPFRDVDLSVLWNT
jgi:hypothetical protein